MKFFEAVPGELFSPLASPNRTLYADALDVLYTAYRENLKIREDTLYSMLRSRLEQQLADATFEGEDIDEEELRDISGRARFLIRKLCGKGWFEKERGDDFEEYITVPSYSSRLLELFHQLRDDRPARGFSYVFGTYSALKVADESESVYDKMAAIYSAYDNTSALINLLQMVYHNVKHYFQMQIDMQDVNQVLASHFNEFGQKVVEAYIRPLKIKDSVPKYRVPIQSVLRSWAEDDALLLAMANATLQDKRGDTVENCRSDLLRKIFWIDERYDNIEHDYLDEIDAQVRRYTRAATQKVENLTNRDQNVRGNLNVLLTALSRNRRAGDLVDQIQPVFQLYEQSFLSEKSLWYRKRPGKRTKAAAVLIQETASDADAAAQAAQLLRSEYGRAAIVAYVQGWLGDADVRYSKDLNIKDDKSYIIQLLPRPDGEDIGSIEDKIKLEYASLTETFRGAIVLDEKPPAFVPSGSTAPNVPNKKKDTLQSIIDKVNERFKGHFTDADRVIIEGIYQMFMKDPEVVKFRKYARDNSTEMFVQSLFPDKFSKIVTQCYMDNNDSFIKLFNDPDFYQKVQEAMAQELYRALRKE